MPIRRPTRFTIHALERVAERLSLSPEEVAAILDHDVAVLVGVDEYSNRQRRLFLSIPDDEFFVAVQDATTGEVVTVLTLDYHANLHDRVDARHIVEAARRQGRAAPNLRKMQGVAPNAKLETVVIICPVPDASGIPRISNLGTWHVGQAPQDLTLLAQDPDFVREMARRALERGISVDRTLHVRLRLGKADDRVDVELDITAVQETLVSKASGDSGAGIEAPVEGRQFERGAANEQ